MIKNYWLSWWQPTDDPHLRPVTRDFEGGKHIYGWWICGGDMDGNNFICAWVKAKSEKKAKKIIKKYWPEAENWVLCKEEADDFMPGDEFPLKDWCPAKKKGK